MSEPETQMIGTPTQTSMIFYPLEGDKTDDVIRRTFNGEYTIITYDKTLVHLQNDYSSVFAYRSVVVNKNGNVKSMAPARSVSYDIMRERYNRRYEISDIIIDEFVEGTMINLFFCEESNSWQIATRNGVGGNYGFFTNILIQTGRSYCSTFLEMFREVSEYVKLDTDVLNKTTSYSFVLQHPKNPLVFLFEEPSLYFIQAFSLENSSSNITNSFPKTREEVRESGIFNLTGIKYPKTFERLHRFPDQNEIDDILARINGTDCMGIMIRDVEQDDRCKIRTQTYNFARKLRGNTASLLPHYLYIRQTKKTEEFKSVFPHFDNHLVQYEKVIQRIKKYLYETYVEVYIRHSMNMDELRHEIFKPLREIHKIYKSCNERIRLSTVSTFVDGMCLKYLERLMRSYLKQT